MQLLDEDKKQIKSAIQEASNSLLRIDAEKDLIKEITENLFDTYKIPKKTISKIIRVYHKQNFNEEVASNEEFEDLYQSVTKTNDN
jgi:phenylpyruvate tautomerase PptA (4-oxalocrotonate tautomerase family)